LTVTIFIFLIKIVTANQKGIEDIEFVFNLYRIDFRTRSSSIHSQSLPRFFTALSQDQVQQPLDVAIVRSISISSTFPSLSKSSVYARTHSSCNTGFEDGGTKKYRNIVTLKLPTLMPKKHSTFVHFLTFLISLPIFNLSRDCHLFIPFKRLSHFLILNDEKVWWKHLFRGQNNLIENSSVLDN